MENKQGQASEENNFPNLLNIEDFKVEDVFKIDLDAWKMDW